MSEDLELFEDGQFPYVMKDNKKFGYYQFGIQRTGTTLIDYMIRAHFKNHKANDLIPHTVRPPSPEILTWKHMIWVPKNYRKGFPVILNYKNPYTWVESMMYRKGQANGGWGFTYRDTFKNLGQQYIVQPENNRHNGTVYLDSLVQTYRFWFTTWLDFYDNNKDITYIIKYEDLLYEDRRDNIMNEIADKFGWEKPEKYNWPNHIGSSQPIDNRIEYYKAEKPTRLERRFVDFINEFFDKELMDRLGYSVL